MGEKEFDRAEFQIDELERVLNFINAMSKKDYKTMGQMLHETHQGLSVKYEVSCKELDKLVDILKNCDGVYGSRMFGGGFGGCTVSLVEESKVNEIIKQVHKEYFNEYKLTATFLVTLPCKGAEI